MCEAADRAPAGTPGLVDDDRLLRGGSPEALKKPLPSGTPSTYAPMTPVSGSPARNGAGGRG